MKLATLLTCLSVQRVHTISLIDSRNMKFDKDATYLYIFEDLKVQRNRSKFVITLKVYMKMTLSKHQSYYTSIWKEQRHFVLPIHRTVSMIVCFSAMLQRFDR